jgi:hypothetical protein
MFYAVDSIKVFDFITIAVFILAESYGYNENSAK